MYAAETLIERAMEQIELAPKLEENQVPGGRSIPQEPQPDYGTFSSWLTDMMNHADSVDVLKTVEGGRRRYAKFCQKALEYAAKLQAIFGPIYAARAAHYADGEQRNKVMGRFKDSPKEIVTACEGIITQMEAALKVLEEGEHKDAKLAAAAK